MNEGERNNNAYVLAAAFNDFGVYQSLAESYVMNYQTKNFIRAEIKEQYEVAY